MHVAGSIWGEAAEEVQSFAAVSGDETIFPIEERLRQILLKQSMGAKDVVLEHSSTAAAEDTLFFMALAAHLAGSCG